MLELEELPLLVLWIGFSMTVSVLLRSGLLALMGCVLSRFPRLPLAGQFLRGSAGEMEVVL